MDVGSLICLDLTFNSVLQLPSSFAPPDSVEQGFELRLKIIGIATVTLRLNHYSRHFESHMSTSISAGMPLALNLHRRQAIWKDADADVWPHRLLRPATSMVESTHLRLCGGGAPVITQGSDLCHRWHEVDVQPHIPHTRDAGCRHLSTHSRRAFDREDEWLALSIIAGCPTPRFVGGRHRKQRVRKATRVNV
jgi:hypothetical protein